MRPPLACLAAGACALALALAGAGPAGASPNQRSILQDDARTINAGPRVREETLDELRTLGVDTVKFTIPWRSLAPAGPRRPAGFAAADPAAYPRERFEPYDAAIAGAQLRGLEVFLQVSGPAPDWATARRSDPPGVDRPDPVEFARFAHAVGTRYSGSYSGLPRVSLWSVWNEPNLPRFLLPQREAGGRRRAVSPHLYRSLYRAAHGALSSSGHANDVILYGELLPVGRAATSSRSSVRPLEFLREMACVDRRRRAYRGAAARLRGCQDYRPLPGTGVAHHPYATAGGPAARPRHPDDVTIGFLPRMVRELDRLGRRGRLRRGTPIFVTEFGVQTDPPDRLQVPIARVPAYLAESEWHAFRNPRVGSWSQYPLVDDALKGTGLARFGGFQSGLRFESGRAKPGVYDAYRRPFFARLLSSSRVELFGGVRTADGSGGAVMLESRSGRGAFRPLTGPVALGARGYFSRVVRVTGAARREYRFRFGDQLSRTARPARR